MTIEKIKLLLKEFDYDKNDLETTIEFLSIILYELKNLEEK